MLEVLCTTGSKIKPSEGYCVDPGSAFCRMVQRILDGPVGDRHELNKSARHILLAEWLAYWLCKSDSPGSIPTEGKCILAI